MVAKSIPQLFNFLAGMMQDKKDFDFSNPEINSSYDQYMINRYLSMCDVFLPFVAEINRRAHLSNETHYMFFKNILPKKKLWLEYIKKVKDLTQDQKVILAHYFKTNLKNVEPMITILSEEEITKIINIYKEENV